jgi:hypothetical protein
VDWLNRYKYQFEAATLMKDITIRLLNHDSFFDEPQAPRNLLTNLPFTLSQIISVWNQLGMTKERASWAFTCFEHSAFAIRRFATEYRIPLQLHALRTTMSDLSNIDTQDRMMDFIQYQHEQSNRPFSRLPYLYGVNYAHDTNIIQQWRAQCLQFYEAHIKFLHNQEILYKLHANIRNRCFPLTARPKQLISLYNTYIAEKKQQEQQQQQQQQDQEDDWIEEETNDIMVQLVQSNLLANLFSSLISPFPSPNTQA